VGPIGGVWHGMRVLTSRWLAQAAHVVRLHVPVHVAPNKSHVLSLGEELKPLRAARDVRVVYEQLLRITVWRTRRSAKASAGCAQVRCSVPKPSRMRDSNLGARRCVHKQRVRYRVYVRHTL
jgi:hypothetical protein